MSVGRAAAILGTGLLAFGPAVGLAAGPRLSDEAVPLRVEAVPRRPGPIMDVGEAFLDTGPLHSGLVIPTGAVWRPAFLLFGTFRSAIQTFDPGSHPAMPASTTEWVNRLDFHGQLGLTETERLFVGFRPFDQDGRFSGYLFDPGEGEFQDEFNFALRTLFFEGDLGELLPKLDRSDTRRLDYGLAVGRQRIAFQDGALIDDQIDALGFSRTSFRPGGTTNFRWTLLWAWNQLHREGIAGTGEDGSASLWGVFTEIDWRSRTLQLDVVFVDAEAASGGSIHGGLAALQPLGGGLSTGVRLLGSLASGDPTEVATDGAALLLDLSFSPGGGDDQIYLDGFLAVDDFRSAARDPERGGPLGRTGILFAPVEIGSYCAPLSAQARDAAGGSAGYQINWSRGRRQIILEAGLRYSTREEAGQRAGAIGARGRFAVGRRGLIVIDGFVGRGSDPKAADPAGASRDPQFMGGARLELVAKL